MNTRTRMQIGQWIAAITLVSLVLGVYAVSAAPRAEAHGEGTEVTDVGLEALRECESGGNYGISGRFLGAYQFTQRTWNFASIEAGHAEWSGSRPNHAPAAVQDAVTRWLWQADPARYNGPHAWPVCHDRAVRAMWAEPTEKVLLLGDAAVLSARSQLIWWFAASGLDLVIEAQPQAAICNWAVSLPDLIARHRPTRVVVASSLQPPTTANGCQWDPSVWGTDNWQDAVVDDAQILVNRARNQGVKNVHWLDTWAYPSIESEVFDIDRNVIVEALEERINAEVTGLTPAVSMDTFIGVDAVVQTPRMYSWETETVTLREGDTFEELFVGTDPLWARFAANLASYVLWTS